MPAFVLVSAKGSPGVTTAAAALAAAATRNSRPLLAELDPSGGSLHLLTGTPASQGLVEAAGRLRRESTLDAARAAIGENTTILPDGIPALVAPSAGLTADSVIESGRDRWVPALRGCALDVVIDAGRWEPSQRTARRIMGADLVVVVCRPTVAGVEHSRHLVGRLWDLARRPVAAVVVGHRPYAPEEIAGALGVPLAGAIAWDPRGVARLWAKGVGSRWLSTRLARSTTDALVGLGNMVATMPPQALPEVGTA